MAREGERADADEAVKAGIITVDRRRRPVPIHDWTRVEAGIFHDFHQEWSTAIKHALNAGLLPSDFYALIEQVTTKPGDGKYGPDVLTLQTIPTDEGPTPGVGRSAPSALAAPPRTSNVVRGDRDFYRRKKNAVVVRHASGDRVVAVIELVSPGNKASRKAFADFVGKVCGLLDRRIHVTLIDLFPPTPRDPDGIHGAIWEELYGEPQPLPPDKRLTAVAYESADDEVRGYVEPLAVGQRLPDVAVFLQEEACVMVPLEKTYASAWESVPRRWRDVIAAGP